MKVTRKLESLGKVLQPGAEGEGGEIAPSLFIRGLSKPIDGLEAGEDFQGHIKGKCRSHTCENRGGKDEHSYDLDVSHFEHHGKGNGKQKKSPRDEVKDAMDKYDKEDEEKKESKKEKKTEKEY